MQQFALRKNDLLRGGYGLPPTRKEKSQFGSGDFPESGIQDSVESSRQTEENCNFEGFAYKRGNGWPYSWAWRRVRIQNSKIFYFKATDVAAEVPRGQLLLNPQSCVVCPSLPLNALGQKGAFLLLVFSKGLHLKNCPSQVAVIGGDSCICFGDAHLQCLSSFETLVSADQVRGSFEGRTKQTVFEEGATSCASRVQSGLARRRPSALSAELLGLEGNADYVEASLERADHDAFRGSLSVLESARVLAFSVEKTFAAAVPPKFVFAFSSAKEQQRWARVILRHIDLSRGVSSLSSSRGACCRLALVNRGGSFAEDGNDDDPREKIEKQREFSASSTRGTASSATSPSRSACLREASGVLPASKDRFIECFQESPSLPSPRRRKDKQYKSQRGEECSRVAASSPHCLDALLFLLEREQQQKQRRCFGVPGCEDGTDARFPHQGQQGTTSEIAVLAEAIKAARRSRALLEASMRGLTSSTSRSSLAEEAPAFPDLAHLPAGSDLLHALKQARRVLICECADCKVSNADTLREDSVDAQLEEARGGNWKLNSVPTVEASKGGIGETEAESDSRVPDDEHVQLLQSLVLVLLERIEKQQKEQRTESWYSSQTDKDDSQALAELRRVFETLALKNNAASNGREGRSKRGSRWWPSESEPDDDAGCTDTSPATAAEENEVTIFRLSTPTSSGSSSRDVSGERMQSFEAGES